MIFLKIAVVDLVRSCSEISRKKIRDFEMWTHAFFYTATKFFINKAVALTAGRY